MKLITRLYRFAMRHSSGTTIALLVVGAITGCTPSSCPDPLATTACRPHPILGYAGQIQSPLAGTQTPSYLVRMYNLMPIHVLFNTATPYYTPVAAAYATQAFARWTEATNDSIRFVYSTNPSQRADIVVSFVIRANIAGLQGQTIPGVGSTQMNIAVDNPQYPPYFFQSEEQLKRVCSHEMGHALGIMGHSPCSNDIMSTGEVAIRPSDADVNTLRFAYHGSFGPK